MLTATHLSLHHPWSSRTYAPCIKSYNIVSTDLVLTISIIDITSVAMKMMGGPRQLSNSSYMKRLQTDNPPLLALQAHCIPV